MTLQPEPTTTEARPPRFERLLDALKSPPRLSVWWRLTIAAATTLLSLLVQYALMSRPSIAPFVFFYPGMVLAAWLGGRSAGALAVALSTLTAIYIFVPPYRAWALSPAATAATVMFILSSTTIILMCAAFRDAVFRAERTAEVLRQQAEIINRDNAERRRAEAELQAANQRLAEADRRKDEFLAVLSHELRNPMAPIKNSLHILERAAPGSEQERRARAVINRQVNQMSRLVDDILDVTRIARGKIQLQRGRLDLRQVVAQTVEDLRSLFVARSIDLREDLAPGLLWVDGDATRLAQALGNLLQNAAKFTPEGGRVSVRLSQEGEAALLRVQDTGVGIPPALLPHIFEPFTQADRTLDRSGRSGGGLGVGLTLVRALVELHGGTITAHSRGPGAGAEFTVSLPAERAAAAAAEASMAVVEGARRVLVIEDNVDAAESLMEALELDEHQVALAFSGPEGLAKARSFAPDVVLCDIGLPGMDGYAVARAFRADPALQGISLVALTGYAQAEDRRKAIDAGFHRHLAKPPNLGTLKRILAELPAQPAAQAGAAHG